MASEHLAGCSERPAIALTHARHTHTHLLRGKAAANTQRCSSKRARIPFPLMAWMSPQLRASNEGLLRPRVARAQGTRQAITIPLGGLFLLVFEVQRTLRECLITPIRDSLPMVLEALEDSTRPRRYCSTISSHVFLTVQDHPRPLL